MNRRRIKQEIRALRELRRLLRDTFAEDALLLELWDIATALAVLRWALRPNGDGLQGKRQVAEVAPAFGIIGEVLCEREESPQQLIDFLDRQFEQDGRWKLERN